MQREKWRLRCITHVGVLFHTAKGQVTVKPFYPNSVLVQVIICMKRSLVGFDVDMHVSMVFHTSSVSLLCASVCMLMEPDFRVNSSTALECNHSISLIFNEVNAVNGDVLAQEIVMIVR